MCVSHLCVCVCARCAAPLVAVVTLIVSGLQTANGNVEAKVVCFYRRRDISSTLIALADKHASEWPHVTPDERTQHGSLQNIFTHLSPLQTSDIKRGSKLIWLDCITCLWGVFLKQDKLLSGVRTVWAESTRLDAAPPECRQRSICWLYQYGHTWVS